MPPGKRGKDWKLCRPPHGAIVYPCKASQSPLLRPRPGISPRHSRMAYSSSIAPGPGGPFRPRPYWLAFPPPIHGPPPGGVYPVAGAYSQFDRGRGYMGPGGYSRGVHESGRVYYPVNVPGIVPGAAPMGAGLVPSTGATGAVKAGGPFPCPERGAVVWGYYPFRTSPPYHTPLYIANQNKNAQI